MGIMPPERRDGQQGQRFPRVQPREKSSVVRSYQ